jgi:hypothetical protein
VMDARMSYELTDVRYQMCLLGHVLQVAPACGANPPQRDGRTHELRTD